MIIGYIIASTLWLLGVLVLCGKGNFMLPGYKMSLDEQKVMYHITRLRVVIGFSHLIDGFLWLQLGSSKTGLYIFLFGSIANSLVRIFFTKTWAKQKIR